MSDNVTKTPQPPRDMSRIEEIHYQLEPEDYAEFMRFNTQRNAKLPRQSMWINALVLFPFLLVMFFAAVIDPNPMGVRGFVGLVSLVGFLLYTLWGIVGNLLLITRAMPLKFFRKFVAINYKVGLYKEIKWFHVWMTSNEYVEVTEFHQDDGDGVVVSDRRESRALWSAVESIDETEELFIFKMAGKGYLLVPKRIFPDETAVRHYLDTVEMLRAAYLRRLEVSFAETEARAQDNTHRETLNGPVEITSPPRSTGPAASP